MRYRLDFAERPTLTAATTPCELTIASIEEQLTRLRSWALIRGAEIAGPPFVAIKGRAGAIACLPLVGSVHPHPETGISVERIQGGPVVRATPVALDALFEHIDELHARLSPDCSLRGLAEFYPGRPGSQESNVVLPLHRLPAVQPVEVNTAEQVGV